MRTEEELTHYALSNSNIYEEAARQLAYTGAQSGCGAGDAKHSAPRHHAHACAHACRYQVFERYDSLSGDLGFVAVGANVTTYASVCDDLGPLCKGFASYGWIKRDIRPIPEWRR